MSQSCISLYGYLYMYLDIKSYESHGKNTHFGTYKKLPNLNSSEKNILDSLVSYQEKKESQQTYDTLNNTSLLDRFNKVEIFHNAFVAEYTHRNMNYIDSIFPTSRSDLIKLRISSRDTQEQKIISENLLNNIQTRWCKYIMQERLEKNQVKLDSINKILANSQTLSTDNQLGKPIAEMPFDAKLYTFDSGNCETLLANLKKANKGKAMIIDFWGTWCGACMTDMPYSKKLHEEVKDLPVEFIYLGTSSGTNISQWKSKVAKLGISGTHILVDEEIENKLMSLFSFSGFPSIAFIDQKGNYRSGTIFRMQYFNREKLEDLLNKYLTTF